MCLCLLTKTQFKIIKNLPTTKSQLKKKRQPHLEKPRKSQKKVGDLPQNRPCKKDPPKEKLAKANHKVFFEIDFPLLELVTPFRAWQQRGKSSLFIHNQQNQHIVEANQFNMFGQQPMTQKQNISILPMHLNKKQKKPLTSHGRKQHMAKTRIKVVPFNHPTLLDQNLEVEAYNQNLNLLVTFDKHWSWNKTFIRKACILSIIAKANIKTSHLDMLTKRKSFAFKPISCFK